VAGVVSDLRDGSPPVDVEGRTVLVVDDGVATGATARAAAAVLRQRGADHVVLAVPVAAPETAERLGKDYDEVVCVDLPERLGSVGEWYVRFGQVSTAEVRQILATART
jgi:putative phosphoribosyl transferase